MKNILTNILLISLSVALICSIIISVQYLVFKDHTYKSCFLSWQGPMIFALLVDIYLVKQ